VFETTEWIQRAVDGDRVEAVVKKLWAFGSGIRREVHILTERPTPPEGLRSTELAHV
jgi:hypothetical protein